MKFHQLNVFLTAVETGSIRAAARKLFLSQASVTRALRELEEDLGTPLVQRSVRGIHLTEGGTKLLTRAKLITEQMQLVRSELKQMQGIDEGTVSIGVTPLVALTVLPAAVAAFRRRYQNVRLHIAEGLEVTVLPGVRQGNLDFGIMIASGDHLGEDLLFEPWFSTPSKVVMREGHPCAHARNLAELTDLEWLATSFGPTGRGGKVATFFSKHGLPPPERILRCDSVLAAWAIIRRTDVVTLAPAPLLDCPETEGLQGVDLDTPPPKNEFGMIMRVDVPLSPVAAAFASCLKEMTIPRFSPSGRAGRARLGS